MVHMGEGNVNKTLQHPMVAVLFWLHDTSMPPENNVSAEKKKAHFHDFRVILLFL